MHSRVLSSEQDHARFFLTEKDRYFIQNPSSILKIAKNSVKLHK
jgi:hypothetical protein